MSEILVPRFVGHFSAQNTELMLAVARSAHGQALNNQIRYARYCHIPEGVDHYSLPEERRHEVVETWGENWLDADVNNLQHNIFTAYLGQGHCQREGLDATTTDKVVRTLLVHDLKEAVIDPNADEGDLTWDESNKRGDEGVMKEHRELAEVLMGPGFEMLNPRDIEEIEIILNDSKRSEPTIIEGRMVEIAERTGYLHSGLSAVDAMGRDDIEDIQKRKFLWMAENVFANHISRLIELSGRYDSVMQFLDIRIDDISHAFGVISLRESIDAIYELYRIEGKDDPAGRKEKFLAARNAWEEFSGRPSIAA